MRRIPSWATVAGYTRRHGILRAVHRSVYKLLGKAVKYMNMRCVAARRSQLRVPSAKETADLQRYTSRFLRPDEVWRITARPECRRAYLTSDYVRGALANGERCFAVFDGDYVAHFSWYSRKSPTRINDHWTLHFDESCVYIYFVYTDPKYRGQKLMPFALTQALAESDAEWAVAFVESSNYASLNVFFALGFHEFARIYIARPLHIPLMVHERSAKRFAFRVQPTDARMIRAARARAAAARTDESAGVLRSQE